MKKQIVNLDKIGSVLKNVHPSQEVSVHYGEIDPVEGQVVVVQALNSQKKYGELELIDGRMSKIQEGDYIAGALGTRKALEGIVGMIPEKIGSGDVLNILNLGGLIGKALSWNKDYVSSPVQVKVLGSIFVNDTPLNIHTFSIPPQTSFDVKIPVIVIMGTAMGTGKTTVATSLVHTLSKQKNLNVAAAKLTGVAAQRDILAMQDAGAKQTLTFLDIGLTSTINHQAAVVPATKTILNILAKSNPDVIVAELGDGIIGWYGVDKLLENKEFIKLVSFTIVCAHDLVGAVGAQTMLNTHGLEVDFFSGPVTNNMAGTDYLEGILHIPSQDIREDYSHLLQTLMKKGVIHHD